MGRKGMVLASVASGTGTVQLQVSSQTTRTATVMAGAVMCAIRIA
jgi:hypothetical protein